MVQGSSDNRSPGNRNHTQHTVQRENNTTTTRASDRLGHLAVDAVGIVDHLHAVQDRVHAVEGRWLRRPNQ